VTTLAPATIDELFRTADAKRWELSREDFAAALDASVQRAFPEGQPSRRELDRYLAGLHAADLALACACALGRESAWDHFILTHRPLLYRSADALDPTGGAREIADGLYADLYGIRDEGGERRSLFRYFHGRSSLGTWLRAVLAQRHVDMVRARRRIDPLPEAETATSGAAAPSLDPDRARLVRLVDESLKAAINQLAAKDRLRLRSYYVLQLTLAQIGIVTGEHEATVSRHLSRTRKLLRDGLEQHLRHSHQLTTAQVARAVELALEDPGGLDLHHAFDSSSERKNSPPDRSEYGHE
jgi:RNA polymerase sigma-70 factor (ECF subfamily)